MPRYTMTPEARLKRLGWAHVALAGVATALGVFLTLGIGLSSDPRANDALGWVIPIFLVALLLWLIPAIVGGLGLVAGRRWAKVPVTFVSVAMLTFVPVGTVLGAVSLWLLHSRDAAAGAEATVQQSQQQPIANALKMAFWAIVALALLGLIVCLAWFFRDSLASFPHPNRLVIGAIVGAVALGVVAVSMFTRGGRITLNPFEIRRRVEAEARQREVVEAHNLRVARLRADPERARFADSIQAGDYWTDEAISYALDPAATVTCEHLVAIERAMRAEGIVVKPSYSPAVVEARCDIDEARIEDVFHPAASVTFSRNIESFDRSAQDPPNAALRCSTCNSAIATTPTHEIRPTTIVFPR